MTVNELEGVRKRPGMYIGDVHDGSGLLCMIWDVIANALDQHLAGHCSEIIVSLAADGSITVEDDGQGFPLRADHDMTFVERALTTLHRTPTLDGHAPHEHVGNRGIGLAPVCALSSWLELDVFREGRHYAQRFERGARVTPMRDLRATAKTGTRLTLAPDPAIFPNPRVNGPQLRERLKEMSYFLPKLTLRVTDQSEPRSEHRFHEPRGLLAYVEDAAGSDSFRLAPAFLVEQLELEIRVEAAALWLHSERNLLDSFANVERTTDGGTHLRGMLRGLANGFRLAAPKACFGKRRTQIERALTPGLSAVVCVRLDNPSFGEPTKSRLLTPAVSDAVERCVAQPFAQYLADKPALIEHLSAALGT